MTVFYLFVAIGFLLTTLLALNVSRVRIKQKITHGDKGNKLLRNAMIAHSNALEQIVPFSIILFVLVKQNTSEMMIQVLSLGFIVVRILHV